MTIVRKVALITGGTSGIGKELVTEFAKGGYDVAFTYFTNVEAAKEIARDAEIHGARALSIRTNIIDEVQVLEMIKKTMDNFQRIDVLINNAGIYEDNLTKNIELDSWKKIIDVNLTGVFYCIKAVIEIMERQQYGRILNIGSVVGEMGAMGAANYSAAKAGMMGLTKSVAREVANKGITVNVVSLGYMNGGMGNQIPEKIRNKIMEQIPMRKFGDITKVAKMILHIVSEEAEYITGQSIRINGGVYM